MCAGLVLRKSLCSQSLQQMPPHTLGNMLILQNMDITYLIYMAVAPLLGLIAGKYIGSYFSERAKNNATLETLDSITSIVEEIKNKYAIETHKIVEELRNKYLIQLHKRNNLFQEEKECILSFLSNCDKMMEMYSLINFKNYDCYNHGELHKLADKINDSHIALKSHSIKLDLFVEYKELIDSADDFMKEILCFQLITKEKILKLNELLFKDIEITNEFDSYKSSKDFIEGSERHKELLIKQYPILQAEDDIAKSYAKELDDNYKMMMEKRIKLQEICRNYFRTILFQ